MKNNRINSKVSIIVPIYNVEKYLQECINSICKQTYSFLEIILVDDGSPDQCGVICDLNAIKDSRIHVIHKENGGLSSARNIGLELATGEYISFVDSDDFLHPQYIEILLELCHKYDCDIAQCDYLCVSENSIKLPLNPCSSLVFYDNKQAIHELCCGSSPYKYTVAWNKLYKRELFDTIRYPLGKIHEDEFVAHQLLWKVKKIAVTNQYLYYYLQRVTSIMGQSYSVKRLDALDAFQKRAEFLQSIKLENEYYNILQKLMYLIDEHCKLLKENIKDYENIYQELLIKKNNIEKLLPKNSSIANKRSETIIFDEDMMIKQLYPYDLRIILYGAGKWGRICYQWIKENNYGNLVNWVDNLWFTMSNMEYEINPIDSILYTDFDYILITIKNKSVQKEVIQNLLSWGVDKEKIFSIFKED